jgi:hypothetical protein
MNNVRIETRVKLAVKNALKGNMTGEDVKAIIRFQSKELAEMKGEALDNWELGLLGAYCVAFN